MISYLPFKALKLLTRIVPLSLTPALGRGLGRVIHGVAKKRRMVAMQNLKAAFGPKFDRKSRLKIIREVYENMGMNIIDIMALPRTKKEFFLERVQARGFQHLDSEMKKGKGAIVLTAHYGNWELGGQYLALRNYPMITLARPQKPMFINKEINKLREHYGIKVVGKGLQLREIIRQLGENRAIGILGDQSGRSGERMEFFGRPVFMAKGAFRIAAATGAPLIPTFMERKNRTFQFEMTMLQPLFCPKDDPESMKQAILCYRDILEEKISENPAQWNWINKRWKYTNELRVLILDDGRVGHLRQAEALAEEISGLKPAKIQKELVDFRSGFHRFVFTFLVEVFGQALLFNLNLLKLSLEPESFHALESAYADVIICTGASTRAPGIILAGENGARLISIMKPSPFSPSRFDLSIIPEHDKPPVSDRIVVTTGALNLITSDYLKEQGEKLCQHAHPREDATRIGLLLGGESAKFFLSEAAAKNLMRQIKTFLVKENAQALSTTSRRTSREIDNIVRLELGGSNICPFAVYPRERNFDFAVGGILAESDAVIVSGESVSMVSEAASSGAYTIVFLPERRNEDSKNKHDLFLENLSRKNIIRLCGIDDVGRELEDFKQKRHELRPLDDRSLVRERLKEFFNAG